MPLQCSAAPLSVFSRPAELCRSSCLSCSGAYLFKDELLKDLWQIWSTYDRLEALQKLTSSSTPATNYACALWGGEPTRTTGWDGNQGNTVAGVWLYVHMGRRGAVI